MGNSAPETHFAMCFLRTSGTNVIGLILWETDWRGRFVSMKLNERALRKQINVMKSGK